MHTQKMSNRTKTHFGQYLTNPADVQKHDHSRNNNGTDRFQPRSYSPYGNQKIIHITAIADLIEVDVNLQHASVTVIAIFHVAIYCHVGTVAHQII